VLEVEEVEMTWQRLELANLARLGLWKLGYDGIQKKCLARHVHLRHYDDRFQVSVRWMR